MADKMISSNPLEIEHPEYERSVYTWQMIRRFVEGPSSVKRMNVLYLPIPAAMLDSPPASTANPRSEHNINEGKVPWAYPQNRAYEAYLRRAKVPDISSFALRGLLGIATRKDPAFALPDGLAYLEGNATNTGLSLIELFQFLCSRVLSVGRVGLLLDQVGTTGEFQFIVYDTESLHNWDTAIKNSKRMLVYVVAREQITKGDEIFSHATTDEFVVFHFDANNHYTVTRHDDEGVPIDVFEPVVKGKHLDRIPMLFVGSLDNTPEVDEPPMQGIVDEALTAYLKDADLSNAEFMTCNPMLYGTGVGEGELPKAIGSNIALLLSNPDATLQYTKTDTSGLEHVRNRIEQSIDQAAVYCANLLSPDKKGIEASETVRLRQSASGASMHSVVTSVASAIEELLQVALSWSGADPESVSFLANTEFADISMGPQEMQSLLAAYMQNTISLETLVENWRRAGLLLEGETNEDELERLEQANKGLLEEDDDNTPELDNVNV